MSESITPKLPKWPFLLGDGLLLGTAYFIRHQSGSPLRHWELVLVLLCVAAGACLCVVPFLFEYHALVKVTEAGALTTVVSQLKNLEGIANQIAGATGKWQDAQEQADKTVAAAKEIAERMTGEVQAFTEFMKRASDSERATLRLEVEKLRRGESEWLQVAVRTLDHVYALHQGACRSGQANLIDQVGSFQNACRDAARRVGLTPFVANAGEPFDVQRHQLIEEGTKPPADAVIGETIATGYTFQGRLLRPALVRLRDRDTGAAEVAAAGGPELQGQASLRAENLPPQ